jgi:hypothetical protein
VLPLSSRKRVVSPCSLLLSPLKAMLGEFQIQFTGNMFHSAFQISYHVHFVCACLMQPATLLIILTFYDELQASPPDSGAGGSPLVGC